MKQWQCPCGSWLDGALGRHQHVALRPPSTAEIIAARDAGRDGDALNASVDITYETWTPERPTREKPDECG